MIRHRPYGSEHPYAVTDDQRNPPSPDDGVPVTLGVTAAASVDSITCQWTSTDAAGHSVTETFELAPVGAALPTGTDAVDGHLSAAQAQSGRSARLPWTVTVPQVRAGHQYSYRFVARNNTGREYRTKAYRFSPSWWSSDAGDSLLTIDSDRLIDNSVQWRRTDDGVNRVRFSVWLLPDEHIVGFGERFDRLDQRGHRLDAVVFEQYKDQGSHGRTYLPMPFAHIVGPTGGWGLHVRTSRRTYFDIAASSADRLTVEVELSGAAVDRLDVATYRGNPREVLDQFLTEVGRSEELPDWVFRLWASGNEWNTQQLVMQRMDTHRDLDVPVGAVVIEAWSDESTFAAFRDAEYRVNQDGTAHTGSDFSYPADGAWPDPKAMIAELHRRDIKVVLWQIPLQKMRPHPTGQSRADADALVREHHAVLEADGRPYRNRGWWFPRALMPDLSTQRTRDWWTSKHRYLVADLDVDGFKTDGGEHAWGHDLRYGDGRRGDDGNNLFGVHYAKAFGNLLRSQGKAPITFSRSGFTGSQAHGIFWAGDENSTWQAFRSSITAGLTASACGIVYWSWDLAGFSGPTPDAELYLRATAAATFMPVMQYHSEFNHHRPPLRDRTPWNIQSSTGDSTVVETFRGFAKIREALVPYLAEQARRSIADGRPLMRALFFDHADDASIWDHPAQYLLGDHLLINPVTEPGRDSWTSYLPAGDWTDIWTGQSLTGRQLHTQQVPLTRLPVYCRSEAWKTMKRLAAQAE